MANLSMTIPGLGEHELLTITTLGGFDVRLANNPITERLSRKAQALLAYLAYTQQAHPRDALAELLWNDRTQEQSASNLRVLLVELRAELAAHLNITRQTVGLDVRMVHSLDVVQLETALNAIKPFAGSGYLASGQTEALDKALSLYHGDFMHGFYAPNCPNFDRWVTFERTRLHQTVVGMLRTLIADYASVGTPDALIPHVAQLLKLDPLAEDTHRQMLLLLARSGQRSAALAHYDTFTRLLYDELGIAPERETIELYKSIRAGTVAPPVVSVPPSLGSSAPSKYDSSAHVFIIYARANKAFVTRLIGDLQAGGVNVWIDKQGLKAGIPDWDEALRDAIRGSQAVLLIASPESRQSRYVKDELAVAAMYQRDIYPIWAAGEQWIDCIPMGFSQSQYLDLRGDKYTAALVELMTTLAENDSMDRAARPGGGLSLNFEPRNPYKGLRAFESKDVGDFFGREKLIETLHASLYKGLTDEKRLLGLIGPSGTGKSSVVMAGLLPRLVTPLEHSNWILLDPIKPGAHPIESLAVTLAVGLPGNNALSIAESLAQAEKQARTLHLLASQIVVQRQLPNAKAVLFIDQFEELFTLTTDAYERQQFLDIILESATEPSGPVVVILTLRADFYSHIIPYAAFSDLLKERHELIHPMDMADLRAVIEKPAACSDVQLWFEGNLVGDLLFEVRNQPGALPLLQFTLDQLFQRRSGPDGRFLTLDSYRTIGGVLGALARHADSLYDGLPTDEHRRLARELFLRLVTPGETEQDIVQRRAALSELELADPVQRKVLREITYWFTGEYARLLTTSETAGVRTIEISHEALIQEWGLLRGWVRDQREMMRFQGVISRDAAEWSRQGKRVDNLYTGEKLREAQVWVKGATPSANEAAFIDASVAYHTELFMHEEQRKAELHQVELAAKRAEDESHRAAVYAQTSQRRATLRGQVAVTAIGVALMVVIFSIVIIEQRISSAQAPITAADAQIVAAQQTLVAIDAQSESQRLAALANDIFEQPNGNLETAALLDIRALKTAYTAQADANLVAILDLTSTRLILNTNNPISSVTISADGRYALTGSVDGTAQLWELATGQSICTLSGHTDSVISVALSPDTHYALTGSTDNTAQLWNIPACHAMPIVFSHTDRITGVAFSPDGRYVLTGSWDKTARLWDVTTGRLVQTFSGHTDRITGVAFAPNGKYVLTGSWDKTARLWDPATGQLVNIFDEQTGIITSVAFSGDSRYVLTGSGDNTARVWDITTGKSVRAFIGHSNIVTSVAFSKDGRRILTGSNDGTARLWDVATGQYLRTLIGHTGYITGVAFDPEGQSAISVSNDGTARVWEATATKADRVFSGHTGRVNSVKFSPDGRYFLTGSDDRTARLWEMPTGRLVRVFAAQDSIHTVAFSPDGRSVLISSEDGRTQLWDIATGQAQKSFLSTATIFGVAFSPDGRSILTGSNDGTAQLWDVATGQVNESFSSPGIIYGVAFSPDGRSILTGSNDGTAQLWDVATGHRLHTLTGHTGAVFNVAFSPDGKSVATGSSDMTVRVWGVATGQTISVLSGHTDVVSAVVFSPNGNYILAGGADRTARLWDVATGQTIRVFAGHTDLVADVAFSPDENYVLTAGYDGTVRLWDTDYHDFITYACTHVYRDFTSDERQEFSITDTDQTCPQSGTGMGNAILTLLPPYQLFRVTLPVWTPIASPTSSPTLRPTPTAFDTLVQTSSPGSTETTVFTVAATNTPTSTSATIPENIGAAQAFYAAIPRRSGPFQFLRLITINKAGMAVYYRTDDGALYLVTFLITDSTRKALDYFRSKFEAQITPQGLHLGDEATYSLTDPSLMILILYQNSVISAFRPAPDNPVPTTKISEEDIKGLAVQLFNAVLPPGVAPADLTSVVVPTNFSRSTLAATSTPLLAATVQ